MTETAGTKARTPSASQAPATLRVVHAIGDIGAHDWDACAGIHDQPDSKSQEHEYNPLTCFDFLSSLEDSVCVGEGSGWWPHHIVLDGEDGTPAGVAPAYLKTNSFGEYVFDHGWADAYESAGGRYYPKVQIAVPFSPVTGRRMLLRPDARIASGTDPFEMLTAGALALAREAQASSVHWTFCTQDEWQRFADAGLLRRTDRQFHWFNRDYPDFDAFLETLTARKRKTIRRERRQAVQSGIAIEWLTGGDITEDHWDAFFAFYMDTGARKWGRPYLNRRFFSLIGERMRDRILLVMARRGGQYIAGALNLIGSHALYGRHWGCLEHHPFLHFEICYYQAIDYAIQHGLARVEAGAQGEHKLARGYEPVTTYSAHYIAHPGLRRAVAEYLSRERAMIDQEVAALKTYTPFKQG